MLYEIGLSTLECVPKVAIGISLNFKYEVDEDSLKCTFIWSSNFREVLWSVVQIVIQSYYWYRQRRLYL